MKNLFSNAVKGLGTALVSGEKSSQAAMDKAKVVENCRVTISVNDLDNPMDRPGTSASNVIIVNDAGEKQLFLDFIDKLHQHRKVKLSAFNSMVNDLTANAEAIDEMVEHGIEMEKGKDEQS